MGVSRSGRVADAAKGMGCGRDGCLRKWKGGRLSVWEEVQGKA